MIVVSLAERSISGLLAGARACEGKADIVEARLDFLQDFSAIHALKGIRLPVICTCRPKWEFGNFNGSELERIRILMQAIKFSDFVDIELSAVKRDEVIEAAEDAGTVSIVSRHYPGMPGIQALEKDLGECRGDLAKIIPSAGRIMESANILALAKKHPGTIAFASGPGGVASRFLSLRYGNPFIYTCLGEPVAPGQVQVERAISIIRKMGKKEFAPDAKGMALFTKKFLD